VSVDPIRLCIINEVNQLSREIMENGCRSEEALMRLNEINSMNSKIFSLKNKKGNTKIKE